MYKKAIKKVFQKLFKIVENAVSGCCYIAGQSLHVSWQIFSSICYDKAYRRAASGLLKSDISRSKRPGHEMSKKSKTLQKPFKNVFQKRPKSCSKTYTNLAPRAAPKTFPDAVPGPRGIFLAYFLNAFGAMSGDQNMFSVKHHMLYDIVLSFMTS